MLDHLKSAAAVRICSTPDVVDKHPSRTTCRYPTPDPDSQATQKHTFKYKCGTGIKNQTHNLRSRVRPVHGGEEDAASRSVSRRFSFGLAGFFGEMGRRLEEIHLQDGTWGDGMDDGRQEKKSTLLDDSRNTQGTAKKPMAEATAKNVRCS